MYGRCTGDVRAMYGGYAGVRLSGRPPRRGSQCRHAATRAHARAHTRTSTRVRTHTHAHALGNPRSCLSDAPPAHTRSATGPFDWPEVNALRKFRVGSPRTCVLVRPLAWGGGCAWHGSKNARSRSRPVAFPPRPLLFNVGRGGEGGVHTDGCSDSSSGVFCISAIANSLRTRSNKVDVGPVC